MDKKFSWDMFLIKITSRKFITAFTGFVAMVLIACKMEEGSVQQIASIIGSFLTLIGYMYSEAIVDKANSQNATIVFEELQEEDVKDENIN